MGWREERKGTKGREGREGRGMVRGEGKCTSLRHRDREIDKQLAAMDR